MTDKTTNTPSHDVFHVTGDQENNFWTKIGGGWEHKDGEGMNIIMNYTPVTAGRLVIRKHKAKPVEKAA